MKRLEPSLSSLIKALVPAGDIHQPPLSRLRLNKGSFERLPNEQLGWWEKLGKRITWWRDGAPSSPASVQRALETIGQEFSALNEGEQSDLLDKIDEELKEHIRPITDTRLVARDIFDLAFTELKLLNGTKEEKVEIYRKRLEELEKILWDMDRSVCFYRGASPHYGTRPDLEEVLQGWKLKSVEDLSQAPPERWRGEIQKVKEILVRLAGEPWSHRMVKRATLAFEHQDLLYSAWKRYLDHSRGLRLYHHRLTPFNRSGGAEIAPLSLLALLEALKTSRHLRHLDLADLPLEGKLYKEFVLHILKHNPGITEIRLARNHLKEEDADELLTAFAGLKKLALLELCGVELPKSSIPKLSAWVRSNKNLKSLTLHQNPLAEDLILELAKDPRRLENLTYLSILDDHWSREGKAALVTLLTHLPRLREVHFTQLNLDPIEQKALKAIGVDRSLNLSFKTDKL